MSKTSARRWQHWSPICGGMPGEKEVDTNSGGGRKRKQRCWSARETKSRQQGLYGGNLIQEKGRYDIKKHTNWCFILYASLFLCQLIKATIGFTNFKSSHCHRNCKSSFLPFVFMQACADMFCNLRREVKVALKEGHTFFVSGILMDYLHDNNKLLFCTFSHKYKWILIFELLSTWGLRLLPHISARPCFYAVAITK